MRLLNNDCLNVLLFDLIFRSQIEKYFSIVNSFKKLLKLKFISGEILNEPKTIIIMGNEITIASIVEIV